MAKINTIHNKVLKILETNPDTRADDYVLILEVLKEYIDTNMSITTLLLNHAVLGIPSIETITRARRKLQEKYPHLIDVDTKLIRKEEEKEFKEYALDNK